MKCIICKRRIGKQERHFYSVQRFSSGRVRRHYWCVECDEKHIDKVDEALSRYDERATTL